jgi:predicted nucleic-acid-binding protein
MPALDTNVLVRYIVRDDDAQLHAAQTLIRQCVASGQALFVPVTVLLELEWVLRSRYGFGKQEVIGTIAGLLSATELRFEAEQALEVALQMYRDGAADFADGLHIAQATQAAELPVWTFDQRAATLSGARLVGR